jgi:hypothetical protein
MGKVVGQLVQLDKGLGLEHELEAALQLLEAEAAFGVVLVELGGNPVPVCI